MVKFACRFVHAKMRRCCCSPVLVHEYKYSVIFGSYFHYVRASPPAWHIWHRVAAENRCQTNRIFAPRFLWFEIQTLSHTRRKSTNETKVSIPPLIHIQYISLSVSVCITIEDAFAACTGTGRVSCHITHNNMAYHKFHFQRKRANASIVVRFPCTNIFMWIYYIFFCCLVNRTTCRTDPKGRSFAVDNHKQWTEISDVCGRRRTKAHVVVVVVCWADEVDVSCANP